MNIPTTITIGIADDHALITEALTSLINNIDGLKVLLTAENGYELIERIAKAPYQPDICLVDIIMPGMDGYDTIKAIKAKYPYIKGVALTGVSSDLAILKMIQCGASGYVLKTIYPQTFKKAMTDVYLKGFHYCDEVVKKFPKLGANKVEPYLKNMLTEQEMIFLRHCCSDMSYKTNRREDEHGSSNCRTLC